MSLSARAIAVEGVGYSPAVLARAGLWEAASATTARPLERLTAGLIRPLQFAAVVPFIERDRFGRVVAERVLSAGRFGSWAEPDAFGAMVAAHCFTGAIAAHEQDDFPPLAARSTYEAQIRPQAGADIWTTIPARRGLPPLAVVLHVITH